MFEPVSRFLRRRLAVSPEKLPARPDEPPADLTDPDEVGARMNRIFRRRLSDRFLDVFREACLRGDLKTAEELLVMLENAEQERRAAIGNDRRSSDRTIALAREELQHRKLTLVRPVEEPQP